MSSSSSNTGATDDSSVVLDMSKGVKYLVEANPGLSKIPPSCIVPAEILSEPVDDQAEVPVVDLAGLDDPARRAQTVGAIASACALWGFFCVINHGFDPSLMNAMLFVIESFFALPLGEKLAHASDDVMRPVLYASGLDTSDGPYGQNWRDYLRHYGRPFHKSSVHLWPSNPPSYREIAMKYLEEVWKLAMRLAEAISEALGLETGFVEGAFGEGSQVLTCNYYPPCPEPHLALGFASHTDRGGITVVMENHQEGLQVLHQGKWVFVPHIPGSFIINIGDCLEVISNGKYKSVHHRALVNDKAARISIAVGNGPGNDDLVQPAAQLISKNGEGPNYGHIILRELRKEDHLRVHQRISSRN